MFRGLCALMTITFPKWWNCLFRLHKATSLPLWTQADASSLLQGKGISYLWLLRPILVRPLDILVGGLKFYRDSFFLSFFLSLTTLRAPWTELNQNRPHARSECDLKMHLRNVGYPLPIQIGGPKSTFSRRLRSLTANLTAYILGTKHDIDNRVSALATTRLSYLFSKQHKPDPQTA